MAQLTTTNGLVSMDDLERLLAHYEAVTASLRTTLNLLRTPTPITASPIPDAPPPPVKKRGRRRVSSNGHEEFVSKSVARRRATAKWLDGISRTEPTAAGVLGKGVGVYVRRGYLVKRGEGFVRTGKAFEV